VPRKPPKSDAFETRAKGAARAEPEVLDERDGIAHSAKPSKVDAAPLDHDDVEVVASDDSPIDESASETTEPKYLPPELGGDESPSRKNRPRWSLMIAEQIPGRSAPISAPHS